MRSTSVSLASLWQPLYPLVVLIIYLVCIFLLKLLDLYNLKSQYKAFRLFYYLIYSCYIIRLASFFYPKAQGDRWDFNQVVLRSTFIPIRSPSLSPAFTTYSFTYQSLRVTLISPLLRYQTIIALQTSLQISVRTSISNYPLSPSTFSVFSYIIIIYPVIIFRGVGTLYYRSAATAAQVRFAGKEGFYLFSILLSHQRI